jgi:hypothetical protein
MRINIKDLNSKANFKFNALPDSGANRTMLAANIANRHHLNIVGRNRRGTGCARCAVAKKSTY